MRHGANPDNRYGGWSGYGLTEIGRQAVHRAKHKLLDKGITSIYSSDLKRAKETAEIVADTLSLDITYFPQFREVNNGLLAGMEKSVAFEKYPSKYWSKLAWTETWHGGEKVRKDSIFVLRVHGIILKNKSEREMPYWLPMAE